MKISKLFHWLYATLMFLPLVFFIPSVFYYGFNEHATNTETTTINYKYESNEVNTIDDLVQGNIYHLDNLFIDTGEYGDERYTSFNLLSFDLVNSNLPSYENDDFALSSYNSKDGNFIYVYVDDYSFTLYFTNDYAYSSLVFDIGFLELENVVIQVNDLTVIQNILPLSNNQLPQYTDYNVIESVSVNTDDTITDKLNRSWNAIFDLPMFSWTKTTFVSGAFVYISGLFGVQPNNPLNYLFAYFVSISICWLVFDVLLYVPNLAHRWLDKGAIE